MPLPHRFVDALTRLRPALKGFWIFAPIAFVALLVAGYTWWWQQVAEGVRANAVLFQAEQQSMRREARWDTLAVSGFPYRLEAQFASPRITAPDLGLAWDGKQVTLNLHPLSLSRAELDFQGRQHFLYAKDGRLIEGGGQAIKALLTLADAGELGPRRIALDIERLSAQGQLDARNIQLVLERAAGQIRVREDDGNAQPQIDISAKLDNLALRGDVALPLGPTIGLVNLEARLKFPPGLRDATAAALILAWQREGSPLEIDAVDVAWGGVTLRGEGHVKLDSQSRPEGTVRLKIGNHRRLLDVLIAEGVVKPEAEKTVAAALNTLAFMSGDPERRVTVDLRAADGNVFLQVFGLLPIHLTTIGPLFGEAQAAIP